MNSYQQLKKDLASLIPDDVKVECKKAAESFKEEQRKAQLKEARKTEERKAKGLKPGDLSRMQIFMVLGGIFLFLGGAIAFEVIQSIDPLPSNNLSSASQNNEQDVVKEITFSDAERECFSDRTALLAQQTPVQGIDIETAKAAFQLIADHCISGSQARRDAATQYFSSQIIDIKMNQ